MVSIRYSFTETSTRLINGVIFVSDQDNIELDHPMRTPSYWLGPRSKKFISKAGTCRRRECDRPDASIGVNLDEILGVDILFSEGNPH